MTEPNVIKGMAPQLELTNGTQAEGIEQNMGDGKYICVPSSNGKSLGIRRGGSRGGMRGDTRGETERIIQVVGSYLARHRSICVKPTSSMSTR